MHATMTHQALPSLTVPTAAKEAGAVFGVPLTLLRLEGAAALMGAALAYSTLGGRWSVFALFFLLPISRCSATSRAPASALLATTGRTATSVQPSWLPSARH